MPNEIFEDAVEIHGQEDEVQLIVRGHVSQTEPLQQWQNSAEDMLAQITADGRIELGSDLGVISALIEANKTVTDLGADPVKQGLQVRGVFEGAVDESLTWTVQEMELTGLDGVDGVQITQRVQISHTNEGDSSGADLRAGDFQAVNEAGSTETPIGQLTAIYGHVSNFEGAYLDQSIGLKIQLTNDGTVDSAYGIQVDNVADADKNYAIHTGAGIVHLGDALELPVLPQPDAPETDTIRLYVKLDDDKYKLSMRFGPDPEDEYDLGLLEDLLDVNLASLADGDILVWDATAEEWVNQELEFGVSGHGIRVNGSTQTVRGNINFVDGTGIDFSGSDDSGNDEVEIYVAVNESELSLANLGTRLLDNLSDVVISSASSSQHLRYNGTNWVNTAPSLDDNSDVVLSSPSSGQLLQHNGTNWVNTNAATAGHGVRVNGSTQTVRGNINFVDGNGIDFSGVDDSGNNEVEIHLVVNESELSLANLGTRVLDNLSDVVVSSPATAELLQYNGTDWVNAAVPLDDLSDVALSSPASTQHLRYNGTNWVNAAPLLDDNSDVSLSSPGTGQLLQYNGTNWVNVASTSAGHGIRVNGTGQTVQPYLNFLNGNGITISGANDVGNTENELTVTVDQSQLSLASLGTRSFLNLSNVPSTFSGQTLKAVRVNAGETALEFYTPAYTYAGLTDVSLSGLAANDIPVYSGSAWVNRQFWSPTRSVTQAATTTSVVDATLSHTLNANNAQLINGFNALGTINQAGFNATATNSVAGISAHGRATGASGTVTGGAGGIFLFSQTGAGTVTGGTGVYIKSGVKSAGTLTTLYGQYIESQTAGATNYAIYTNAGTVQLNDQLLVSGSTAGRTQFVLTAATSQSTDIFQIKNSSGTSLIRTGKGGSLFVTANADTGGPEGIFGVTGVAHTALSATSEYTVARFNASQSYEWTNGGVGSNTTPTQRTFRFDHQTLTSTSATYTFTDAATVYISNAPQAPEGSNVAITNAYALWVDAGKSRFDGNLILNSVNIETDTSTGTKFGTSTSQKLGFWNATPVTRPSALTTQLSFTYTAPGTPDYAVQNLTNSGGYGFVTQNEGNTVLSIIANLQTRLSELESKLQTIGLLA